MGRMVEARRAAVADPRNGRLGQDSGSCWAAVGVDGAILADLAKTLQVTRDELLGSRPIKQKASPKKARLLKRLQQVEKLPEADQRAVLQVRRRPSELPATVRLTRS
jgi:hypothetical protein